LTVLPLFTVLLAITDCLDLPVFVVLLLAAAVARAEAETATNFRGAALETVDLDFAIVVAEVAAI
jgi:hypothetical protein